MRRTNTALAVFAALPLVLAGLVLWRGYDDLSDPADGIPITAILAMCVGGSLYLAGALVGGEAGSWITRFGGLVVKVTVGGFLVLVVGGWLLGSAIGVDGVGRGPETSGQARTIAVLAVIGLLALVITWIGERRRKRERTRDESPAGRP